MLNIVDLLVKVARFVMKVNNIFYTQMTLSKQVGTRRLTILSLPLQLGFLGISQLKIIQLTTLRLKSCTNIINIFTVVIKQNLQQ